MFCLMEFKDQILIIHNIESYSLFITIDLFYIYAFFKKWFHKFFLTYNHIGIPYKGTSVIQCFAYTIQRAFLGKDESHCSVLTFGKVIIGLYWLMYIGCTKHSQLLLKTPLQCFRRISIAIYYLDAINASIIV